MWCSRHAVNGFTKPMDYSEQCAGVLAIQGWTKTYPNISNLGVFIFICWSLSLENTPISVPVFETVIKAGQNLFVISSSVLVSEAAKGWVKSFHIPCSGLVFEATKG